MFIAIGESIVARAAALGGYISFSLTACLKTPYEQVHVGTLITMYSNYRIEACGCQPLLARRAMGRCGGCAAATAALVAVFVGLLVSGGLKGTGFFPFLDRLNPAGRGQQLKGVFPAMHEAEAWGFTLAEMPDLSGQVIFVTGGNVGLGYWTAHHLAAHGAAVVIGCRSEARCEKAAMQIRAETASQTVETALLDLASFASIRACASALAKTHPRLNSLILNAGVMIPPFGRTAEGLEMQIGVNHFGHFLLTQLLLPQLEAATAAGVATIVAVSSNAHFVSYPEGILPSIERMNDEQQYNRVQAYGQSKLANILFAQELAARTKDKNILVNAVHPGAVDTDLLRHAIDWLPDAISQALLQAYGSFAWHPREAALTQLFAAVSPTLKSQRITGKYYHPIARETTPDPHAADEEMQRRLWRMTEDFISQQGS